VKHSPDLLNTI